MRASWQASAIPRHANRGPNYLLPAEVVRVNLHTVVSRWGMCIRDYRRGLIHVKHFGRLLPHRRMLPSFWRLLIDAHRSQVNRSHLIDLSVFG